MILEDIQNIKDNLFKIHCFRNEIFINFIDKLEEAYEKNNDYLVIKHDKQLKPLLKIIGFHYTKKYKINEEKYVKIFLY